MKKFSPLEVARKVLGHVAIDVVILDIRLSGKDILWENVDRKTRIWSKTPRQYPAGQGIITLFDNFMGKTKRLKKIKKQWGKSCYQYR